MAAAKRRPPRRSAAEASILQDLPVAVLTFDGTGLCLSANARAVALFEFGAPAGEHVSALFADWSARPPVGEMAGAGGSVVLTHADGRVMLCQTCRDAAGTTSVTLADVSAPLKAAERGARDGLTGLFQRAALRERLAEVIAEARGSNATLAVHFLDLDRFKAINDTLGHPVGDGLLVKVAERLARPLGEHDLLARLGGDEFLIVQVGAEKPDAARSLAARLLDLVGRPYLVRGHMLNVGVSVGIALFPADGDDVDTLLRHADLALYRAKAEGRGVHRFFEPSMNARMQARRLLEIDLRRALPLRQLRLCFQPLIDLSTDRVTGFEALLRWDHPRRGPVPPAEFIPLAEEIGLIGAIGDWVLRTACAEAMTWSIPATISVNISPVQFKGGKLVAGVTAALVRSRLPAERLELEITEGALLDETNLVLEALHAIRALGVRISMDDFGTGYSSLSYLRKFPFDKIKIDQSFIRGLGSDADCDAIVRAVARLGAGLGMRITAEGVETTDQLDRVRLEGCTDVQGYLTGRPLSATDVSALIEHQGKTNRHAA